VAIISKWQEFALSVPSGPCGAECKPNGFALLSPKSCLSSSDLARIRVSKPRLQDVNKPLNGQQD
jgi:hypothetical protein